MRTRLLLVFLFLSSLALLSSYMYFQSWSQRRFIDLAEQGALLEMARVRERLEQGTGGLVGLQTRLEQLGREFNGRIAYLAMNGTVLAESSTSLGGLEPLEGPVLTREFLAATRGNIGSSLRYSQVLGDETWHVARTITADKQLPQGVLHLAVPLQDLVQMPTGLGWQLGLGLALAVLASAFLSWWSSIWVSRVALGIADTLESIGQGDYERRLQAIPAREFGPLIRAVNDMARGLQNRFSRAEEQNQQFETVLNGMHEGVMVLDRQGKVSMVNKSLLGILDARVPIGRSPIELLRSPELQAACEQLVVQANAETIKDQTQILVETSQGHIYEVTILPLNSENQTTVAIVVFHDITELKRLERVRSDFVANVSHELRTPLTSIKGYAETLLDVPSIDADLAQEYLQIIARNANAMSRLLEDLLQLSRLESNGTKRDLGPVELKNAINAAWKYCLPMARERGLSLETGSLPAKVCLWSEYDSLVQVLRNLMENAIKFSPKESQVRIQAERQGGSWQISVIDQGPGVGYQDQRRIFERFYRVQNKHAKVSGTGLGLAICRHIIRNQGGRIWVQSPVPGQIEGSAFRFVLEDCQAAQAVN